MLIAGDNQEPAFDTAVDAMAGKLESFGVPSSDISILKATAADGHAATRLNIRRAFAELHPASTEGCFVFITRTAERGRGLVLARDRAFLSPRELGGLLNGACGNRPTVVIASGCYSGSFAEGSAMPAANRAILTAARDDRPSFGCNAGLRYTVFDQCVLDSMERGIRWADLMGRTRQGASRARARDGRHRLRPAALDGPGRRRPQGFHAVGLCGRSRAATASTIAAPSRIGRKAVAGTPVASQAMPPSSGTRNAVR